MTKDEEMLIAIRRFEERKDKWKMPKRQKSSMDTFTFKAPDQLMKDFDQLTRRLNYISRSEHIREIIRYEIEVDREMRSRNKMDFNMEELEKDE